MDQRAGRSSPRPRSRPPLLQESRASGLRATFDPPRRPSRVTAGLTVLAYALLEDVTLVPVAAVLIAAFVVIERRTKEPARPA